MTIGHTTRCPSCHVVPWQASLFSTRIVEPCVFFLFQTGEAIAMGYLIQMNNQVQTKQRIFKQLSLSSIRGKQSFVLRSC